MAKKTAEYVFPPFSSELVICPLNTAEKVQHLASWILANVIPFDCIRDPDQPVVVDNVFLSRKFTALGRFSFHVTAGQFEYVAKLCRYRAVDETQAVWSWKLSPSSPVLVEGGFNQ